MDTKKSEAINLLTIFFTIWGICWILFGLDHETKSFADLLSIGNLVALLIYFLPTFTITFILYSLFLKQKSHYALVYSMLIGIPTGIAGIMMLLM